ncbi:reverse transcriptase [Cucumis melo var. makuwa]|uniref:Reverse transcriptase n=1 Tax=Cucumis melo var. makuwa TaxID=1194695 RepID=A0A5D3D5G4_CUCMM|nr:reverse transcriptase [Cucumis melo var. makuwa]TYK18752.1 reverse transcriptase [Cucumis melo var. makuwa]
MCRCPFISPPIAFDSTRRRPSNHLTLSVICRLSSPDSNLQNCQIYTSMEICPSTLYNNLSSIGRGLTNSITDWGLKRASHRHSPIMDNHIIMVNQFSFVSTARNNDILRISVGNSMVDRQETSFSTLSTIAQSGMSQSLGLINIDGKNSWILHLGATEHLTGFSEHFVSYSPCVGNEKIRIVDDSLAPIAGKEQIVLFDDFSLQNVLHMPKLSYNLLSISKITRELHCKATFLPESVCFRT